MTKYIDYINAVIFINQGFVFKRMEDQNLEEFDLERDSKCNVH